MVALLAAVLALAPSYSIERSSYGVPYIAAPSADLAFEGIGYATAQDRLWQMEKSRRLARGRMAEVFGASFVTSDRSVAQTGYTDDEVRQQVEESGPELKAAFEAYARGVNRYLQEAAASGSLPKGYADNGFQPEPWTPEDSAAISIYMISLFGKGGAGEIRNLALLNYLQARENLKDSYLDVMDDFGWHNDPASPTTVPPEDDPLARRHRAVSAPTREVTEAHVKQLPKASLLELLPGIRLSMNEDARDTARRMGVVSKTGSYAAVVSAKRSSTGKGLLLGGPQMGLESPSVVYEVSVNAPGLVVAGMLVPGTPFVAVGMTPNFAWTITTGVADTDDIFMSPMVGEDSYSVGGDVKPLQLLPRTLNVKGGEPQTVVQKRTLYGPVVVTSSSGKTYFSRRSGLWMSELKSVAAVLSNYGSTTPDQIEDSMKAATANFNFFYVTAKGDIGYRYLGRIPIRAEGIDPRFPTPGKPEYDWKGFWAPDELPRVRNPKGGLITNWNNKPATWWSHGDTPVWGRVFRVSVLNDAFNGPVSPADLERAVVRMGLSEPTYAAFKKYLPRKMGLAAAELTAFEGTHAAGSVGSTLYFAWFGALRELLFEETTGNFMSADNFKQIAQPTVLLNALEKRTKVNYLGKRKAKDVCEAALDKAIESLTASRGAELAKWGYKPGSKAYEGSGTLEHTNRGTYIQIIEMGSATGRSILPPGNAESGAHQFDQLPLAQGWAYKPMRLGG